MTGIERIRTVSELDRVRDAWERLYAADPHAQMFLSWSWLRGYLASGKRGADILLLRDGDGLVAALPLARCGFPLPWLSFDRELRMAANPAGDYTGMLCRPEREHDALDAFARAIARIGWENFDLADTRDPRMERLARRVAALVGGDVEAVAAHRCYSIELPATWEEYLASLDRKARKNTARAMRRTAELPGYRFTEASAADVERHIDALLALKRERFGGMLARYHARYHRLFRASFDAGACRIFAIWDGERPISAAAAFVDPATRTFGSYMRGHDAAYDERGPGRAMVGLLIRRAIEDGYRTYDFLRGDEAYKREFTELEHRIHHYRVPRPGVRAALVNAARPAFFALKLRIANLVYGGGRSL